MINYRSKNKIIVLIRNFVSKLILNSNSGFEINVIKNIYNLIVISLQKINARLYLNRPDIKKFIIHFNKNNKKSSTLFIFSSKDRLKMTKRSLSSIAKTSSKEFDVIWLDGSLNEESVSYTKKYNSKKIKVIGKFFNIGGGPDVVIILGLLIGKKLKYKNVGFIENDIIFNKINWYSHLYELLKPSNVGAATVVNYKNRNIKFYKKYSELFSMGASMFVIKQKMVDFILSSYGIINSKEIIAYINKYKGVNLEHNYGLSRGKIDYLQGADWRFCISINKNGYRCLSTIPSMAKNVDNPPKVFKTVYL